MLATNNIIWDLGFGERKIIAVKIQWHFDTDTYRIHIFPSPRSNRWCIEGAKVYQAGAELRGAKNYQKTDQASLDLRTLTTCDILMHILGTHVIRTLHPLAIITLYNRSACAQITLPFSHFMSQKRPQPKRVDSKKKWSSSVDNVHGRIKWQRAGRIVREYNKA